MASPEWYLRKQARELFQEPLWYIAAAVQEDFVPPRHVNMDSPELELGWSYLPSQLTREMLEARFEWTPPRSLKEALLELEDVVRAEMVPVLAVRRPRGRTFGVWVPREARDRAVAIVKRSWQADAWIP